MAWLERTLAAFKGTVVAVTHDRYSCVPKPSSVRYKEWHDAVSGCMGHRSASTVRSGIVCQALLIPSADCMPRRRAR